MKANRQSSLVRFCETKKAIRTIKAVQGPLHVGVPGSAGMQTPDLAKYIVYQSTLCHQTACYVAAEAVTFRQPFWQFLSICCHTCCDPPSAEHPPAPQIISNRQTELYHHNRSVHCVAWVLQAGITYCWCPDPSLLQLSILEVFPPSPALRMASAK